MPIIVPLAPTRPFDSHRVSFITHLNYIKYLEKILSQTSLTVSKRGTFSLKNAEINRFQNLFRLTKKSIEKDIELARQDSAFAVIVAPWFPVKCYYALYYLESILIHLSDGSSHGFERGGHTNVRKILYSHISTGLFSFSKNEFSTVYSLISIDALPSIVAGRNASPRYWDQPQCKDSILKKLKEYKVHNQILLQKWNLRKKRDRDERDRFIDRENLSVLDFFYWYRIKANYRDLDYVDFENGISEQEVFEYIQAFNNAFEKYKGLLENEINRIIINP